MPIERLVTFSEDQVDHAIELAEQLAMAYHDYAKLPRTVYAGEARDVASHNLRLARASLRSYLMRVAEGRANGPQDGVRVGNRRPKFG